MESLLGAIGLLIAALSHPFAYQDYQIETGDKSIEGFIEWLKQKYYYKK